MVTKADLNGDGKLDRWELYEFCVLNYVDKETVWKLYLIVYCNLYFQTLTITTENNQIHCVFIWELEVE